MSRLLADRLRREGMTHPVRRGTVRLQRVLLWAWLVSFLLCWVSVLTSVYGPDPYGVLLLAHVLVPLALAFNTYRLLRQCGDLREEAALFAFASLTAILVFGIIIPFAAYERGRDALNREQEVAG